MNQYFVVSITQGGTFDIVVQQAQPIVVSISTANAPASTPDLQEVTDEGNSTTNDIDFGSGAGIVFNNGSKVKEGTTDAGQGGNKGVALKCSIDYEHKWEAGRLYTMEQDGFTIREVSHNFNITPTATDDSTKGFVVGTRWLLDNGDFYLCTDNTATSAVWVLKAYAVPNLQQVTDSGSVTTNAITVGDTSGIYSEVGDSYVGTENTATDTYAYIASDGSLGLGNGTHESTLKNTNVTTTGIILEYPDKPAGSYTIATTNDIPATPTLQEVTDAGNSTTNTINVDSVAFDLTPTAAPGAGQIAYKANTGGLAYLMNSSAVESTIGQTMHAYVHNADSVTITKGQAVYLFSASGNKASVKLANNTSDSTSAKTFGLAAEDIAPNNNGFIICQGVLDGLNLGTYNPGDTLYLGATAGSYTAVKPYAPNHLVYIGVVERANNGNGQIYVNVQNGYELNEIHDVDLISVAPVNNDILTYVTGSPNLWKPRSIATILGYTPVNPTRSISTTSPLSGGGNLSADRTISIADAAADGTTKGAATFTANDFNSAAGVISLDYTNGQSASAVNKGFLTAADWSTFNGKQDNIEKIILTGVNQTTTAATAQNITGLVTSSLTANKNYTYHGTIRTTCSGAGGVRFGISLPAGATARLTVVGLQVAATATSMASSASTGALTGSSYAQSGTTSVFIYGKITMAATPGTMQFQFASQTAGQTSTIVHSGETFLTLIKMD